jgi:L-serine dehydratase
MYKSLADAISDAEARGVTLTTVALDLESQDQGRPVADIRAALARALNVMRGAVDAGMTGAMRSNSGLVGGDAAKLVNSTAGPLAATPFHDILIRALAVQEVNAAMGVIVAAPTAGGAGVLPAVLTGIASARGISDEKLVDALATAAEMLGGSPRQAGHATALAMQSTLGLICDPLGGLVELPCVFRNATGSAIALAAIEMALAGIEFAIPVDEVIDVMGQIGREMDVRYRETAGGGLAATPTGRRLAKERLYQIKRA